MTSLEMAKGINWVFGLDIFKKAGITFNSLPVNFPNPSQQLDSESTQSISTAPHDITPSTEGPAATQSTEDEIPGITHIILPHYKSTPTIILHPQHTP